MALVQGKIAVIEGLDNDAESGIELQFSSGISGYVVQFDSSMNGSYMYMILGMFSVGYCYGGGTIIRCLA